MLDAGGRLPQSITQGNRLELGNYDQCIDIHEELKQNKIINGRYCLTGLAIPINISFSKEFASINEEAIKRRFSKIIEPKEISIIDALTISICIPDACYPSDIFGRFGIDSMCQTRNDRRKFESGDIAFL